MSSGRWMSSEFHDQHRHVMAYVCQRMSTVSCALGSHPHWPILGADVPCAAQLHPSTHRLHIPIYAGEWYSSFPHVENDPIVDQVSQCLGKWYFRVSARPWPVEEVADWAATKHAVDVFFTCLWHFMACSSVLVVMFFYIVPIISPFLLYSHYILIATPKKDPQK